MSDVIKILQDDFEFSSRVYQDDFELMSKVYQDDFDLLSKVWLDDFYFDRPPSGVFFYRADTTVITADTTSYTADYSH